MYLNTVEFTNYCQHTSRKDVFGPGVIGLVGPNGSGKSNYLKGILRGLTGVSMNEGKNEDDVSWNAENGDIAIEFCVHGHVGTIKRNLKSSRCNLKFGDRQWKTAKEVDSAIYGILGISPKLLQEMVFVPQGNIYSILTGKPAERAKAFQMLFGTEGSETLRDLFQTELTINAIGNYSEQIDQLEGLKQHLVQQVAEHTAKINLLTPSLLTEPDYKKYSELVQTEQVMSMYKQMIGKLTLEINTTESSREQLQAKLNETQKTVKELSSMLTSTAEAYKASKIFVTQEKEVRKKYEEQQTVFRELIDTRNALQALGEPPTPPSVSEVDLEVLRGQLAEHSQGLALSKSVTALSSSSNAQCPTCMQSIDQRHIARHEQYIAEMAPVVSEISTLVSTVQSEWRDYRTKFHIYTVNKKGLETKLEALNRQKEGFGPLINNPDSSTLTSHIELIAFYEEMQKSLTQATKDEAALTATLNSLVFQLQQKVTQKEENLKFYKEIPDADYKEAHRALELHGKSQPELAALRGARGSAQDQLARTEAAIAALKKEESVIDIKKEWRDLLERSRIVLHRDQLPNLVAQSYLKSLNTCLMKYLETFNVPFMAYVKPDLSIECTFGGGRVVPVGRLSGGQLVMLGIAFHFAKHELFAGDIGILVLDEPTVFLDSTRIPSVFATLERVKSYSKTAGLQLIVVTHEPKLMPVFDRTIEL